jgi:(1->4)-alpha-D-glucan 1-alpha-D-glucosylmutase
LKNRIPLAPRIPVATYRLQLNSKFRFSDAKMIVGYLSDLGITDIYASPYFKAKEGSIHGYDIVDHNSLNPEIGSPEEYEELMDELAAHGMGQIVDIVPNHMCLSSKDNVWWMDVLENGPSSPYACFFDIDWDPSKRELRNKVLLPLLGAQYGKVLENQELRLVFDEGAFFLYYYEHRLPIIPKTYIQILNHRIDDLRQSLPAESLHFMELLSIITSLNHLPPYTETDKERIAERYREKEVVKKRIWNLYNESPDIRVFIDENVEVFNGVKGVAESFDLLDRLLSEQVYRLSDWRVATEEINYRRFFDINELGAIRMEEQEVFRETHRLLLDLVRKGWVTGLRIDHPDGLYDPAAYLKQLQRQCFIHLRLGYQEHRGKEIFPLTAAAETETEIARLYDETLSADPGFKPFYIVGEKILLKSEIMPEEWPIFSTTGYVFLNSANGIFVDTKNAKAFSEIYDRFIRKKLLFQDVAYERKKLNMQVAMSSEINTLGFRLNRISEKDRHTRDFTLNSLTDALIEIIAYFPVYRTYVTAAGVTDRDRQYIELAVSKAKRRNPAFSASIFDFLGDVLLLRFPEDFRENDKKEWVDFVMRFQQLTGPVMAKGVEDTAFYIYNRLVSLNEVGGMPERFGTPLETFHGQNIERSKFWPHALIATSTHDTKRSEDVRARIDVLSEIPDEWRKRLVLWRRLHNKKKTIVSGEKVPDPNEEYLLYQTLLGTWPSGMTEAGEGEAFRQRIRGYMLKAVREAKINTSWISPDALYEEALLIFVDRILGVNGSKEFLRDFSQFQKKISNFGMYNSLSQVLLKITSPGVPDFYQGTELWNLCLVDPDNRGPVDFETRRKLLDDLRRDESARGPLRVSRELAGRRGDGRIKLYTIYKALNHRKAHRDLYANGEYLPLEASREKADHVCAFARRSGRESVVTVVPRFLTSLIPSPESLPCGKEVWDDSILMIPFAERGMQYRNIFTGELLTVQESKGARGLFLAEVFSCVPVALLEESNEERIYSL